MKKIDSLVAKLSGDQIPIFAKTAKYIVGTASRDSSTIADLAKGILQDPSLTNRVLKLANSALYNRNSMKINTISRSIMRLGVDTIRSICISASLVENFLKKNPREEVVKEIVTALHAAVQARSFAERKSDASIEEIYISALLFRIGYLAFWCSGSKMADELESKLKKAPCPPGAAEVEVLGFRIHSVSRLLAQKWQLGNLLETSLAGDPKANPRIYNILLGHKLVQSVQNGWDTEECNATIKLIAKHTQLTPKEASEMVRKNAEAAVLIAQDYGLQKYTAIIKPGPKAGPKAEQKEDLPSDESQTQDQHPLLLLEILQELSTILKDKRLDLNLLFSTLLEGIYRGIGMDRVMLAIITPDHRKLAGKYGVGWHQDQIEHLVFPAEPQVPNIFHHVLKNRKAVWVNGSKTPEYLGYITPDIKARLSTDCFLVMPIMVHNRAIGVVCADRHTSGRDLDETSFTSFQFFCQMVNAALSSLSG